MQKAAAEHGGAERATGRRTDDAVRKLLATGFAAAMLLGLGARHAQAVTTYTWSVYDANFGYWTGANGNAYGGGAQSLDNGSISGPSGANIGSTPGSFTFNSSYSALTGWNIQTSGSNNSNGASQDNFAAQSYTPTQAGGGGIGQNGASGFNVSFAADNSTGMQLDLYFASDLSQITTIGAGVLLCTYENMGSYSACRASTESTPNGNFDSSTSGYGPDRALATPSGVPTNMSPTLAFNLDNPNPGDPCQGYGPCVVLTGIQSSLAQPDPPAPAPVPEPGSMSLMLTALGGLGLVACRRRRVRA